MNNSYVLPEDKVLKYLSPILSCPGVFLETSYLDKDNSSSFLFTNPEKILVLNSLNDKKEFFKELDSLVNSGYWIAGYFSYELGYALEPCLNDFLKNGTKGFPLAWVGAFKIPVMLNHREYNSGENDNKKRHMPKGKKFSLNKGRFNMSFSEYKEALSAIKDYLEQGQTYQVNFTMKYKARLSGDISDLYLGLRKNQPTSYSGVINDGKRFVLSSSPELFFRTAGNIITARPMKGTCKRGRYYAEDLRFENFLRTDRKNRAENVMIVDLIRNDLGRISKKGSVKVPRFFNVEKYPSLFQMTSDINSRLKEKVTLEELFKALFPSGSVTGAPKIKTMQIIEELEKEPRGVYTGAIGFISPNKSMCFNVAIRTLVVQDGLLECGIGGGIVYDSTPYKEYQECLLKSKFLHWKEDDFSLIETILWNKGELKFLNYHLERMKNSAEYFNIQFDTNYFRETITHHTKRLSKEEDCKVRVLVDNKGFIRVECFPLSPIQGAISIKVSSKVIDSQNIFLYHKTTYRNLYDREAEDNSKQGIFESIFVNERGELTEGTKTNLFISCKGKLYTTPVSSGILPGVLRKYLLEKGKVQEKKMFLDDLESADGIFVGNSVRGLLKVDEIVTREPESPGFARR